MSVRVVIEPDGDLPDNLMVNGHLFVHVAACPCERIQREVARLELDDMIAHAEADFGPVILHGDV